MMLLADYLGASVLYFGHRNAIFIDTATFNNFRQLERHGKHRRSKQKLIDSNITLR